jgi:hypothetical protein
VRRGNTSPTTRILTAQMSAESAGSSKHIEKYSFQGKNSRIGGFGSSTKHREFSRELQIILEHKLLNVGSPVLHCVIRVLGS